MNAPVNMDQRVSLIGLDDAAMLERVEAFVHDQGGSIFHRPQWLKAVQAGTRQMGRGLVAEQLGVITGWLPLTEVRSRLFGSTLVSSGFGVGGGILANCDQVRAELAQSAEEYAARSGIASVEMRGGAVPQGWESWNDKHCGFERSLSGTDDDELKSIPRKARAEVRKGLKNGLEVRIGRSRDDLNAHYKVYSESVRNLGTPVFPRRLFSAMIEAFPGACDILTVLHEGKPLSSVLSFYHGGAVLPFWGGGTFEARGARSNELMYYELMLHARHRGMERFDFGRSKTGSGPYKFKKNWGFEPVPLTYSRWTAVGAKPRDIDPTSESYSRKIELWKKLPLPVANLVGPFIARDLA